MKACFAFHSLTFACAGYWLEAGQDEKPNPFLRVLGNGQWWTALPTDNKDIFLDG